MNKGRNHIRLTEGELNKLIESAILEAVDKSLKDRIKDKIKEKAADAALYTSLLTAGTFGIFDAIPRGLENQERYERFVNAQAARNGKDIPDEIGYDCTIHQNDTTKHVSESKIRKPLVSENKIARIIRRNLMKFA